MFRIVVPEGTSDGSKYMSTSGEMWSADAFPLASTGKRSGNRSVNTRLR